MKRWLLLCCLWVTCEAPSRGSLTSRAVEPHVLIVGIDGLRPDQVAHANTPHLDRLARRRSGEGRNAWTESRAWNGHSATNWGVLLTGVGPERTGATENDDTDHRISSSGPVYTVFGHLRAARPDAGTYVFNTWPGIGPAPGTLLGSDRESLSVAFCPRPGPDAGARDRMTTMRAARVLRGVEPGATDAIATFVHLSQVDAAGHATGYRSAGYRTAVETADRLLGVMLTAIEARANRRGEAWMIFVASDHGGPDEGLNHADNTDVPTHTCSWWVGGDVRPGWREGELIPTLYDIVPTALRWLGVEPRERLDGRVLPITRR